MKKFEYNVFYKGKGTRRVAKTIAELTSDNITQVEAVKENDWNTDSMYIYKIQSNKGEREIINTIYNNNAKDIYLH